MHLSNLTSRSRLLGAGIITAVVATALVATADPAAAAVPLTITPATGPAATGTGPTVTINTTTSVFSGAPTVEFQLAGAGTLPTPATGTPPTASLNACWPTYLAPITPGSPTAAGAYVVASTQVARYSATRLYVKAPSLPTIGTPPTKYNVCVYSGNDTTGLTGSALVASIASGYTVSAASTVTSVSPISGPAKGGTPIVVTGANLTGATVTLGGTSITPVIASDGLSFTAVTPPHAADGQPVTLSVTTAGGTVNKTAAFTYSNGVNVTPNTAPRSSAASGGQYVEISGVGFSSLNPTGTANGATPDAAGAHVYLTRGTYNSATLAAHKTNPALSECSDVLVMNDGLLICKVNLTPYTRALTDATVAGSGTTLDPWTISSPTANFTQNDVGVSVAGTSSTTPTTGGTGLITAVTSPTTAVFTSPGTPIVGALNTLATIGNIRTIASVTTTTSSNTLAAAASTGNFTTADIGRTVGTTGLYITSIVDGDNVVMSGNPAAAITAGSVTINNVIADGAYTLTVVNDGRLNATSLNPSYNQSVISSGATFTVGDYLKK